jgi:hypothetical protein
MSKKTRWPLDAALEAFGNEPTVAELAKYQLHPDGFRKGSQTLRAIWGFVPRPLHHRGSQAQTGNRLYSSVDE